MSFTFSSRGPREAQRGVVLLYCLIALVILMVGGVAVVRSFNSTLFGAGNIAFKRDMVNQGERAVATVMAQFSGSGAFATSAATAKSNPGLNYSAKQLPANSKGIPLALIGSTDVSVATGAPISDADSHTEIRYVVDRLCTSEGSAASLGAGGCIYAPANSQVTGGSSTQAETALAPAQAPMYRLTIRVTGPRDTQVFLQSSFSKPE